jgi:DNA-binding Lrp family transcriptional regulator
MFLDTPGLAPFPLIPFLAIAKELCLSFSRVSRMIARVEEEKDKT